MPYLLGKTELFTVGIGILIVALLMLRFYIARQINRQTDTKTRHTQQS